MSAPEAPAPAAPPRRGRNPILAFFLSPFGAPAWKALSAILLGFVFATTAFVVVTSLLSAGASLIIVLVGIPVIALAVECARLYARIEVWRMGLVEGGPLYQRPHRPLEALDGRPFETRLRAWFEAVFLDSARWFDMAYVAVSFPLAIIEFVVMVVLWSIAVGSLLAPLALLIPRYRQGGVEILSGPFVPEAAVAIVFAIGVLLLPTAAMATRGMAILHRYVVEGMLCISPAEALRRENERLRESRSAAVELEASELRRIERDLHDGAQQRLVMLAIDLSLAEGKVDEDPAAAKTLIAGARDQARQALAEIREVVRGTAPAILLDRGLVAALGAVAGRSAVPAFLDSDMPVGSACRTPWSGPRTTVSEALANVGKHAAAQRVQITLRREPTRLGVWVRDDGRGGATLAPGGGLAGCATASRRSTASCCSTVRPAAPRSCTSSCRWAPGSSSRAPSGPRPSSRRRRSPTRRRRRARRSGRRPRLGPSAAEAAAFAAPSAAVCDAARGARCRRTPSRRRAARRNRAGGGRLRVRGRLAPAVTTEAQEAPVGPLPHPRLEGHPGPGPGVGRHRRQGQPQAAGLVRRGDRPRGDARGPWRHRRHLDKFEWSAEQEREGTADEVADAILAELLDAWGQAG
ncbi:MAG: sensor domain-containing protein [Chloroflexota bacterium]